MLLGVPCQVTEAVNQSNRWVYKKNKIEMTRSKAEGPRRARNALRRSELKTSGCNRRSCGNHVHGSEWLGVTRPLDGDMRNALLA